ncbi:ribosome rescue GTPase HflX [Microbulbifer thermotolerans]|uniref:GTPase HflX n=1 Tax=Microbulbifer thermotolerans TaxID=252514 RepID=A0A143HJC4_MICTH|nr:ribosome rescue GTPase HflX [Microbulbifer thermotolerans]AMX01372.1 GTPase HflX [Microbulbifer thermotolerans]MCX2782781.1 GTPase HflX [Microbulbifer thermotolerans]MCX2795536.1 GTPase HflX [Microbulbifer thermotolerans]MCX2800249.1 GTPase HflX [Microbulbifer thermotolerans]MCX2831850.1 GTPase HflX [Microbulbifer thermotolerans]
MFFERPESGELAVLVHLELSAIDSPDDPREFEELALSAGADPVAFIFGQRAAPDPKTFVGRGKLEDIRQAVVDHGAELVIFDHALSPSQERNIERELKCRVLDRTGLILDIFAQRARTHEGKLQVELAQLRHMATRLVRGWTHLERQKGGIGLRGPGETQLETDRRLLRARIDSIEKKLEKVRRQREQGRRARSRAEVATVSLVGYTNAGKSTLFNRLTDAGVYVRDQLFATLDPTMRRVELPSVGAMILADTVGFVSHLPHKLVEAFRATLEEAGNATLLLHVVDAAAEDRLHLMEEVQNVLEEIGAAELPQLFVFNKIDLLADSEPRIERDDQGQPRAVWLSAASGAGCDMLVDAIAERLGEQMVSGLLLIPPQHSRLRAQLYAINAVQSERYRDNGDCELQLLLPRGELQRLLAPYRDGDQAPQWQPREAVGDHC